MQSYVESHLYLPYDKTFSDCNPFYNLLIMHWLQVCKNIKVYIVVLMTLYDGCKLEFNEKKYYLYGKETLCGYTYSYSYLFWSAAQII